MLTWSQGRLENLDSESWQNFETRVTSGIDSIVSHAKKDDAILLTSSGGAISMAIKQIMGLSAEQMIDLNFQIKNSSFSSFEIKKDRLVLSGFNQTPHLELGKNKDLLTYA